MVQKGLPALLVMICLASTRGWGQGYIDSLEQQLATSSKAEEQLMLHNQIAYQYHPSDSALAYHHAQVALALARSLRQPAGMALAYKNMALTQAYWGYTETAISLYDTAFYYFEQAKDSLQIAAVLNNMGRQLCQVGAFERAIRGYHQAEDWARDVGDKNKLLIFLFNHAACLTDAFKADASITVVEEALTLAEELDNWYIKSELYSLLGINYSDLKKYDRAEAAYDAAFACLPKAETPSTASGITTNNPDLAANILNNRGILFLEQERFERAYSDFKTALRLAQVHAPDQLNAAFYINIGIAAKALRQWEESMRYFQEGLEHLDNTQQLVAKGEALQHVSELHYSLGNGLEAYQYLQAAHHLRDSLLSVQTAQNLQELDVKYQTAQYRRELSESNLQLQEQRHRLSLYQLGGLIGLLLLAGAYWLYHAQQRTKLLQLEKRQAQLQYGLLRAQMNPHFIFNALNAIQGFFVNQKPIQGNEFLGKFSLLIRRVLDQSKLPLHSLSQELETLGLYLDIEKERLEDQLDYTIEVAANVDTALIELPPLIFQPFVENAIWHGIAPKQGKGHIWIKLSCAEEQDLLLCQIKDNGVGLPDTQPLSKQQGHVSQGIAITQERLGEMGTISLDNNPDGAGVCVHFQISIQ